MLPQRIPCPWAYIAVLFILACNTHASKPDVFVDRIDVSEQNISRDFAVSDIVAGHKFIMLQQTTHSFIGAVDKIVEYGNKIFIVDRFTSSSVFVFDSTGTFLYILGGKGKGPGQYIYPHDLIIDQRENEVLLLDAESRRINHYDLDKGSFKFAEEVPFSCTRFIKYDNYYAFVGGGDEANLIITNLRFKKRMSFFPQEQASKKPNESFHIVNDSLILFQLNFKDTLYRIKGDRVTPYRRIEYGDAGITWEETQSLKPTEKLIDKFPAKKISSRYYFETNDFIFFTYVQDKEFYVVLKPKQSNNIKIFPYNSVVDDLAFGNSFPVISNTNNEGEFLAAVDGHSFYEGLKEQEKSKRYHADKKYQAQIQQLKAELFKDSTAKFQNPIIVKMKFADF